MTVTIKNSAVLIVVYLLMLLGTAGCQNGKAPSPTVQLTMAGDVLAATENILATAQVNHLIPPEDAPAVKASVNSAHSLYLVAVQHKDDPGSAQALADLQAALNSVVTLRLRFGGK